MTQAMNDDPEHLNLVNMLNSEGRWGVTRIAIVS